ncbi:hypothetical protein B296_00051013, partial [Ensete ventricosum]
PSLPVFSLVPPFLISVTPCAASCFFRSQDSSCCKESAPPALHPAHRQLPRHGGLCCSSPLLCVSAHLLDWLLGKGHFALMRRAELKTLVDMHGNESFLGFQAGKGGELTHDETTIITGALDLTQKTAKDAMTTILETFSLDINSKLDMYVVLLINKLLMLRNIVNLYLLSGTLWV